MPESRHPVSGIDWKQLGRLNEQNHTRFWNTKSEFDSPWSQSHLKQSIWPVHSSATSLAFLPHSIQVPYQTASTAYTSLSSRSTSKHPSASRATGDLTGLLIISLTHTHTHTLSLSFSCLAERTLSLASHFQNPLHFVPSFALTSKANRSSVPFQTTTSLDASDCGPQSTLHISPIEDIIACSTQLDHISCHRTNPPYDQARAP